ncbi:MAG: pseudaminic acid synthase [Deltaproteobacteria bacterium]|nr:pseudaminic acid synthase [Deltaproteobacteria bacterium]MBW2152313.1 pseudaminic acid synthase [Deltaproteobacteria bacterium]
MRPCIEIGNRRIGPGEPIYIIAEMSANHGQDFDQAVRILHAAKEAGADAVKLQTYTPDTLTIPSDREYFRIGGGTLWDGRTLYDLYSEAYMPWEWQPKLKPIAEEIGIGLFSTAYDSSAVDFLEEIDVPVHKVASFENVDVPLIEKMARSGKPLIISTGMASLGEIEKAVQAARNAGATQIALLKCTSAYPAPPDEMNLRTIPHMAEAFGVPVGLSDHTLANEIPVAAVVLGACIIEKHFTLSRSDGGPDSAFSMEPEEFRTMVRAIRNVETALGRVQYRPTTKERESQVFRRSLFVVRNVAAGEVFSSENVRSIRPGYGLPPKFLEMILGRRASRDIRSGTPLTWDLVGSPG